MPTYPRLTSAETVKRPKGYKETPAYSAADHAWEKEMRAKHVAPKKKYSNPYIAFVKQYAKARGITYFHAIKEVYEKRLWQHEK